MLEAAIFGGKNVNAEQSPATQNKAAQSRKVLHWRENDRMGGKVPVWETSNSAKSAVTQKLAHAANPDAAHNFKDAMAYADGAEDQSTTSAEPFGFGDLLDMVNPLQQLPVVGHIYREITGDDIKPISKIIGGGLYGGAVGAAAGLVNTAIEYETGKDIPGNVIALALNGEKPQYRSEGAAQPPVKQLNAAIDKLENGEGELPGNMIGFTDLGYGKRAVYERVPAADGRTAGTMIRKHEEISAWINGWVETASVTRSANRSPS